MDEKITTIPTPWHEVYKILVQLLQRHYTKFQDKAGIELFNLINNSPAYKMHNTSWINKAAKNKLPEVDPIHFFVSFNRNKQTILDREDVINAALLLLNPSARTWKGIDFTGCPAPVAFQILRIRPQNQQRQIWKAFNDLARNGKESLNNSLWEMAQGWEGIQIPSFTIFLFWIRSDSFLPLDKNTKQFLISRSYLESRQEITFQIYLSLLDRDSISNYREISALAVQRTMPSDTDLTITDEIVTNFSIPYGNFRIVGINTLEKDQDAHKILNPHTYYPFDRSFTPLHNNTESEMELTQFHFQPHFSDSLYQIQNFTVNLSAIVGKNGSGKSSIIDLLLMGVYSLSKQNNLLNKKYKKLPNLQFELYWHSNTLYRLRFEDKITLRRFRPKVENNGSVTYTLESSQLSTEHLDRFFFYSILINYSHYALNGSEIKKDWVTPLSVKNDSYSIPVVINPQRLNGNININREKELLNMRLLLNLLELHDTDYPIDSFRRLDNEKYIHSFRITPNKTKIAYKKSQLFRWLKSRDEKLVPRLTKVIFEVYHINLNSETTTPFTEELQFYIVSKLWIMAEYYLPNFHNTFRDAIELFKNDSMSESEMQARGIAMLQPLLEHIQFSQNHFTIKFKQAINFFRYTPLQEIIVNSIETGNSIELDFYNNLAEDILSGNIIANKIELLPPAIFKLDFFLEDQTSFQHTSSGEYQLISVLSSILYHIRNIESNITETTGYEYVSILLDEVELYFHPDMQRHFVRRLLYSLSQLDSKLIGIHILFSTHSPFILSDLQQTKILKLNKGRIANTENGYNTFAANIHDLLADEFFLEAGYMGAYAEKHIQVAINQLNYRRIEKEIIKIIDLKISERERDDIRTKLEEEARIYKQYLKPPLPWSNKNLSNNENIEEEKLFIFQLIDTIGEPVIRENLRNMYNRAYPEAELENIKAIIKDMMIKNKIKPQDLS